MRSGNAQKARAKVVLPLILVGALALSACGSGSTRSNSTATASTSNSQASSAAASGGASSGCLAAAQAQVAKSTAALSPPSPGPKIDVAKNAGKSVWLILPVVNPLTTAVEQGFKAGGALAGLHPVVFEGQGSTVSWNSGVAQAVAQHASVIILYGISESLVSSPLSQATAAGTKIIDAVDGNPTDPLPKGVYAHVSANFTGDGAIAAASLLAHTNCKTNVGIFGASVLPVHVDLEKGAQANVAKLCASCKTYVNDVDPTTVATAVEPQVATLLRAHPEINALFPVFDQMVPYAQSAVSQVMPSIKMVSHDGVAAQLNTVRSGNTALIGDISFPPIQWIGWTLIDTAERAMLGVPPGNTTIPSRLITKGNAGANNNGLFPAFKDLTAVFAPAWGKR